MKRLVVTSGLSIFDSRLGDILDYKDKTLYTFTDHTDELKDLIGSEINKHVKIDIAKKYYLISGKGEISVKDNYKEFNENVKNLVPVNAEIYVRNKNNSMNNGTDYVNTYLTYSDDELLEYLTIIDKKNKFSRWKRYAIVVGIIKGFGSSDTFSDSADVKITFNNTLLRLSKNMKITNKKSSSPTHNYGGCVMSSTGRSGSQTVGYEVKVFTFGVFSSKPRLI